MLLPVVRVSSKLLIVTDCGVNNTRLSLRLVLATLSLLGADDIFLRTHADDRRRPVVAFFVDIVTS